VSDNGEIERWAIDARRSSRAGVRTRAGELEA
jgi:hypothetical protein